MKFPLDPPTRPSATNHGADRLPPPQTQPRLKARGGGRSREENERALLDAARAGDVRAFRALVARGVDLAAARNAEGKSAAMVAAGANQAEILREIVRAAGRGLLTKAAKDGGTPAMSAAVHGQTAALQALGDALDAQEELNVQDEDGWTALHFAVAADHPASVSVLLAYGADPYQENDAGETALTLAHERELEQVLHAMRFPSKDPNVLGDELTS